MMIPTGMENFSRRPLAFRGFFVMSLSPFLACRTMVMLSFLCLVNVSFAVTVVFFFSSFLIHPHTFE